MSLASEPSNPYRRLHYHTQRPTLAEQLGFSKDSTLVLVHADDIGMHKDQTAGALDCMQHGMCRTGSVMVPCPDFEHVLSIWKKRPQLDLGIHLTLNSEWGKDYGWSPVLPRDKVPSLYNRDGIMWPTRQELKRNVNVQEAVMELEAQVLKVLEIGLEPTHIDGHMDGYLWHPDLARAAMALSRKYNLPMLPGDRDEMRALGFVFPDTTQAFTFILGENWRPHKRKKAYDGWLRSLKPGVHWVCVHPSFMTEDFASKIRAGYADASPLPRGMLKLLEFVFGYPDITFRKGDYDYWTSPDTKALADDLGITFIGYRGLKKRQAENWGL